MISATEMTDAEFEATLASASDDELQALERQLRDKLESLTPELALLVSRKGRLERKRDEQKKPS